MLRRTFLGALALLASGLVHGQDNRPYVLLISLDGFRYDYAALHGAPNLTRLAKQGVQAEALIPVYPSATFPSHLSIVTGLYPEHHGIVANVFYDPARRSVYRFNQTATDGTWYGGTPLWVLAEQQGVRTATFFWPGSDAEIQGKRPREYRVFEGAIPNGERVRQVIDWFARPEAVRPHFVTLYMGDVDRAGHNAGPESAETRRAVKEVDQLIGHLLDGLGTTGTPVNVLIVSDHGMVQTSDVVRVGAEDEFAAFEIPVFRGTELHLHSSDARLASRTVAMLNRRDPRFRAYLRAEIPESLHFRNSPRIGDVVVMPTGPQLLYIERPGLPSTAPVGLGQHGFNPEAVGEMRGIFYAQGPALKSGLTIPAFENVHIYPLIAELLRLTPPANLDGRQEVLRSIVR